jgi:hypothetical protein
MNDVQICSNACIRLGVASFASFSADTTASNLCNELYPQVKASLLSRHNWHFATKQAQLSREVDTPALKWAYQYVLPSDRIHSGPFEVFLSASTYQAPFKEWEIVGDKLMSDASELHAQYSYNVDEADMPPYFIELLVKMMMLEVCIPLLGKDSSGVRNTLYADVWTDGGEFQRAKFADSRNHPPNELKDFSLIDARHGAMGRTWR